MAFPSFPARSVTIPSFPARSYPGGGMLICRQILKYLKLYLIMCHICLVYILCSAGPRVGQEGRRPRAPRPEGGPDLSIQTLIPYNPLGLMKPVH